jgi:hypothetical protein
LIRAIDTLGNDASVRIVSVCINLRARKLARRRLGCEEKIDLLKGAVLRILAHGDEISDGFDAHLCLWQSEKQVDECYESGASCDASVLWNR